MTLTKELLHEIFDYKDGLLYRKKITGPNVKVGDVVCGINNEGYSQACVNGKKYKTHRLVFLMHHGFLPEFVDHINGNRVDNRIENLRVATRTENAYNKRKQKSNTSGTPGVNWDSKSRKWRVRITKQGSRMNLGLFEDLELAQLVAMEARNKYHGEFANHG